MLVRQSGAAWAAAAAGARALATLPGGPPSENLSVFDGQVMHFISIAIVLPSPAMEQRRPTLG